MGFYQRQLYRGKNHGSLTSERIEKLNKIGMVWSGKYDSAWESGYAAAENYYIEHGDLNVVSGYQTEDGILLGRWLRRQAENRDKLSDDKIDRLNAIEMIWENQWERRYQTARKFLLENPGYIISQGTVIGDFWVGKWLVQQMRSYDKDTLQPYQKSCMKELIEETGISSETVGKKRQREQYKKVKALILKYGSWKDPAMTEEEKKTSTWIMAQIRKIKAGKATQEEQDLLRQCGVTIPPKVSPWMEFYACAQKYYVDHGNLEIAVNYRTEDGVRLGAWISRQRSLHKAQALTKEQITLLESIEIQWNPQKKGLDRGLNAMFRYYETHGDFAVPVNFKDDEGFPLYQWMCDLRKKKSRIPENEVVRLTQMGFEWRTGEQMQLDRLRTAIADYINAGHTLNVPYQFKTGDGFAIGRYLNVLRKENLSGKHRYLTPELRELLDSHGMKWE